MVRAIDDTLPVMNKTTNTKLSAAVAAMKQLPTETLVDLIEEFSDRVASFADTRLSPEQHAEVTRRLALPPRTVPSSYINAILAQYLPPA